MKRGLFLLILFAGCAKTVPGPVPGVAKGAPKPPPLYDFFEPSQSSWTIDGNPVRLVQIKNRETGKVYLMTYHMGFHSEVMVKIDEWQEEPDK